MAYRHIWSSAVEVLSYEWQPSSSQDRYALADMKNKTVIGHFPPQMCFFACCLLEEEVLSIVKSAEVI